METFHNKEVVVCQNQLVTSRQPEDIPAFIEESLRILILLKINQSSYLATLINLLFV